MATIDCGESRIHYLDFGAGEAVVMLHCSSASGGEWRGLCEMLGGDDHRLVVPDQWSCGRSDPWPEHRPFSLAAEAAPVIAILSRIGRPAHLIGHSYGGAVALWIARERPDLLSSLALVEPSNFHLLRDGAEGSAGLFDEIAGVARDVEAAMAAGDRLGGMERFVDYWGGEGAWSRLAPDVQFRMGERLPKVELDFGALFGEAWSLHDLADFRLPTLVLRGERSPGPSRRLVEMVAKALPGARLEEIAGAGHMSPFTHGAAVNAALGRHLRACSLSLAPARRGMWAA